MEILRESLMRKYIAVDFSVMDSRKIRVFVLIAVLAFLSSPTCFAETFTGKIQRITEDRTNLAVSPEFTSFELPNGQSYRLVNFQEETKPYWGKSITLEAAIEDSFYLRVSNIIGEASGSDVHISSAGNMRLLVGTFSMTGAPITAQSSPSVREILIDDATRSVKRLLELNSYNAVTIDTVAEAAPVTLSFPPLSPTSNCYPWYNSTFLPAARAAFAHQGYDYTTYDRVLYIVPEAVGSACNFAGLAVSSYETFYSGAISSLLVLHEFGHNFGFGHASSDPDDNGVINEQYGGFDCAMSFGRAFYNLLHVRRQNWFLDAGGVITPVTATGVTNIQMSATELSPVGVPQPQFVEITPLVGGRPYYLQFRKNSATLAREYNLDAYSNDRLYVMRHAPGMATNTLLIKDLIPGTSYTDPTGQVLIDFRSEANNVASVQITLGDADSDSDGILNSVDTDDDNDGVADTSDCSPTNPTRWTKFGYLDQDMDGYPTNSTLYETLSCLGTAPGEEYTLTLRSIDNCYLIPNNQQDTDGDGIGDACDAIDSRPPTPRPTAMPSATPTTVPLPTLRPGQPTRTPTPVPGADVANVGFNTLIKGKKPKAQGFALGVISAPSVQCSLKVPTKKKASAFKTASNIQVTGALTTFECNFGTPKAKGKYLLSAKACVGSRCKTAKISLSKR